MTQFILRKVSEDEYLRQLEASDIPLEWVDGYVYPRAESSLCHCRISANLLGVLLNTTQNTPHWVYCNQMRLRLAALWRRKGDTWDFESVGDSVSLPPLGTVLTLAEIYRATGL